MRPYIFPTNNLYRAAIAQLGERQTEDLKVPGSIPGLGILLAHCCMVHDDCHTFFPSPRLMVMTSKVAFHPERNDYWTHVIYMACIGFK